MKDRSTAKVAFRAAAGPDIGVGHIKRCLALSEHFEAPLFAAEARHFDIMIDMGCTADRLLGVAEGETIVETLQAHADVEAVILDTLHTGNTETTASEVSALLATGRHVTVIDSMPPDHFVGSAHANHRPDLLVTPYLGAKDLRPLANARKWLAGAEYAILPSAYLEARSVPLPDNPRILVACGGADPTGLSARIARLLVQSKTAIDVVIGPHFDRSLVSELENLARQNPMISLHYGLQDLLQLQLASTVVVGRPGLLRYEVAALGRMGIYLWESEAYTQYFSAFHASGLAEIYLATDADGEMRFDARVAELTCQDRLRQISRMSEQAMATVDGGGANRIVAELESDLARRQRKVHG